MAEQSGKLILAPPGSGKSYWIKIHPNTDWKEGDSLYPERFQKKQRNEDDLQELDELNVSFKKRGYKVITGDWWSLRNFDAIVLPPLDVLEERLRNEERPGHNPRDADATIRKFNEQSGIPIFDSIDDAVAFVDEDATTGGALQSLDEYLLANEPQKFRDQRNRQHSQDETMLSAIRDVMRQMEKYNTKYSYELEHLGQAYEYLEARVDQDRRYDLDDPNADDLLNMGRHEREVLERIRKRRDAMGMEAAAKMLLQKHNGNVETVAKILSQQHS